MSCFFNNWNYGCNRCQNRCCFGPTGPRGATGPIGPIGPTGPTLTYLANFINPTTGALAVDAEVPLTNVINTDTTFVTQPTTTTVQLQPANYLVTYNANATSTTAGEVGLSALLNGIAVPQSVSTEDILANDFGNVSSSFVLTVTAPNSTLTLENTGDNPSTFTQLNFTIQRIV